MDKFQGLVQQVRVLHPSEDPSHDFLHILRVRKKCEQLGTALNARMEILIPAALLHDLVHVPKNHPDREKAAELAAEKARHLLMDLKTRVEDIEAILQVIREHSYSAGKKPTSLESAILQDADRLDALGAIGIARVFSCGTLMGSSFYEETDPFAANRSLNDKKFALDHFYVKLLKPVDLFNTEQARQEAQKKLQLMKLFLEQLREEIC
jgi:uncharacterized protein